MKKVLIISFLIFTILISFFSTSYATILVTEESIQQSFTKYTTSDNNSNTENYAMKVDKTNKMINLTMGEDIYNIGYDLSGKPTFTVDLTFNTSMSKTEWENEANKTTLLMTMFVLIADHEEIDFMDSMTYMMSSMFKNSNFTIIPDNITNGLEYAKYLYDNKENSIDDTLFTLTTKKVSETSSEYKVQSILVINNNADFSKLKGTTDNLKDSFTNSNNASNSLQENVNKVTNSTSKLPQTGNFFDIKDALLFLILACSAGIVFLMIPNVKYRNIK